MKEQMPILKIPKKTGSQEVYLLKRPKILQILKEIMTIFDLSQASFHLACVYTELILTENPEIRYEFVVTGCILLASKFVEKDARVPKLKDLALFFRGAIISTDIKEAETFCIKLLNYKLNYQSAYCFLEFCLQNGIVFVRELKSTSKFTLTDIQAKCFEILEVFLLDRRYLDFTPLQIACSIITVAREMANVKTPWNNIFQNIYSIKIESFMNCYIVIKRYRFSLY